MSATSIVRKLSGNAVLKTKYITDSPLSTAAHEILAKSQGSLRLVISFITG